MRKLIVLYLLFFGDICSFPLFSATKSKLKLVMLGDSITKSGSANEGEKITDYVQSTLNNLFGGEAEWSVINEGVGSENAHGALKRIKGILKRENPEFVSLAYGLIDSNKKDPRWFEDNINKLLLSISTHNSNTRIIVITTVPVDESIHIWGKDKYFNKFGGANNYVNREMNSILRKVALKNTLPFIDLFRYLMPKEAWKDSIKNDGIHPDSKGNELIGEYIGKSIFAFYSARIKKNELALQWELEARQLMMRAIHLFFSSKTKAVEECDVLAEQAWDMCPYLPEILNTFSFFTQINQ
jgi:lysophospholipase L1-like esterase